MFHVATALALVGLVLLELRNPRFRADTFGPGPRRRRNWTFFVASLVPMYFLQSAGVWSRAHLPTLIVPDTLPFAVDFLACTLVAELVSWISHYVKHRFASLWVFHFQHHREEHFSVWMVSHTHGLEVAISGTLLTALLTVLGFSPLSMQLYFALYAVLLTYHHSDMGYSLGWLDWIVVSPAYHRLHHHSQGRGNYGSMLTVFDVLFGTASWPRPDDSPAALGLPPGSTEPFGFRAEMLHFLSRWRGQRQ
ncbi:sterol desaturase family protein [Hyalangium minutum]|uniref:Sterol desaturase n=1 Tax=Hyalangium minutum TaxID=394096 RepID=A0A085W8K9_9BACT|nr:sterol desaturase family protein [Hyalangium minutum]KFE64022.1 Sterol desaturase [Hyalangium minutum]